MAFDLWCHGLVLHLPVLASWGHWNHKLQQIPRRYAPCCSFILVHENCPVWSPQPNKGSGMFLINACSERRTRNTFRFLTPKTAGLSQPWWKTAYVSAAPHSHKTPSGRRIPLEKRAGKRQVINQMWRKNENVLAVRGGRGAWNWAKERWKRRARQEDCGARGPWCISTSGGRTALKQAEASALCVLLGVSGTPVGWGLHHRRPRLGGQVQSISGHRLLGYLLQTLESGAYRNAF